MSIIEWLASRFPGSSLNTARSITSDAGALLCTRTNGEQASLNNEDVQRVILRTTDQGPFEEDVFYILEMSSGILVVPQAAPGSDLLLVQLQHLPGFNNDAVIEAMSCTDNREFLCWERT